MIKDFLRDDVREVFDGRPGDPKCPRVREGPPSEAAVAGCGNVLERSQTAYGRQGGVAQRGIGWVSTRSSLIGNIGCASSGVTDTPIVSGSSTIVERRMMDESLLIYPGEVLKEELLEPHGLTANRLAVRLDIPPNAVTAIINRTRGITGPMSRLLGHAFGMSAEFFANLQTRHDLDLAKINAAKDDRTADRLRRADELYRELCAG